MASAGFISQLPFEHQRIGAVAIYCSDGRYNEMFDEFLHEHLKLPRYDRLVLPGGPAALAGHFAAYRDEAALVDQLGFLIESHELRRVVLIAHHGCGFYLKRLGTSPRALEAQQREDLKKAADRIESISGKVRVDAFLAELAENRVLFEPVKT